MADPYRPEFTAALRLLAEAFAAAEGRGADRPVIVGGAAVEFHTGGGIQSADFDLVSVRDDILAEELETRGFKRKHQISLHGLYHPDLLMVVDFVSGRLFGGRTDRQRLVLVDVDPARGTCVAFPPIEDMIADRLGQHESEPGGRPDMLEQARLLFILAGDIDKAYLEKRVGEECLDPGTLNLLETVDA